MFKNTSRRWHNQLQLQNRVYLNGIPESAPFLPARSYKVRWRVWWAWIGDEANNPFKGILIRRELTQRWQVRCAYPRAWPTHWENVVVEKRNEFECKYDPKNDQHPKRFANEGQHNWQDTVNYLVSGPNFATNFSVNFRNVSKQALENFVIRREWFGCASGSPVTATTREFK